MIKIEAIVRPERINEVTHALEEAGVPGFHYENVTGQGRQRGVEVFVGRGGQTARRSTLAKTRIVTVVPDGMKDAVVNAIIETARTGEIGDGKIFVTQVTDAIRVRTGESGDAAI
jgi:nitrogen regulatory protein PII